MHGNTWIQLLEMWKATNSTRISYPTPPFPYMDPSTALVPSLSANHISVWI